MVAVLVAGDRSLKHWLAIAGQLKAWLLLSLWLRRELVARLSSISLHRRLLTLPYQLSRSHCRLKTPDGFTAPEFLEPFHFRKHHIRQILHHLHA